MSTREIGSADARSHVSLRWLIRVRWGAAIGQVAALLVAQGMLGLVLPMAPLIAIVAISALTNLAAMRLASTSARTRASGEKQELAFAGAARRFGGDSGHGALAGTLLAIDTLLLTISLALTGGPLNPFSVFYLVYITLAAVVLGARWTWFLTVLAACGYGSLFLHAMQALPAQGEHAHTATLGLSSHLQGMWWAFVFAASLTAYFVVKLSSAIERRDQELARIREQALRAERLASLTTLAAGAAHELSTPLATIAVVTGEVERAVEHGCVHVQGDGISDRLLTDLRLIRAELQRCRGILDRMAAQAGETVGEMPAPVSVGTLVAEALRALPPDEAARVKVETPETVATLTVPGRGVVTALVSLLRNAIDASTAASRQAVILAATADNGVVRLIVRDRGAGMAPDVLARAGEPFFSTKPAGAGMGLGLFLTRALAERLGGTLHLESTIGAGTTATLELRSASGAELELPAPARPS
jgi:two-component system, sensor histidine kinase RegB